MCGNKIASKLPLVNSPYETSSPFSLETNCVIGQPDSSKIAVTSYHGSTLCFSCEENCSMLQCQYESACLCCFQSCKMECLDIGEGVLLRGCCCLPNDMPYTRITPFWSHLVFNIRPCISLFTKMKRALGLECCGCKNDTTCCVFPCLPCCPSLKTKRSTTVKCPQQDCCSCYGQNWCVGKGKAVVK